MADVLTWWMSGPVGALLASPAGAPLVAAGSAVVLAAVALLIDAETQPWAEAIRTGVDAVQAAADAVWDRVVFAVRRGLVAAVLVVAVYAPHRPAGVAR